MFLSVTAQAAFPVLNIAVGDGGIIVTGAGITFAGGVFVAAGFADAEIRTFAGGVSVGAGAFGEDGIVIGAGVCGCFTGEAGGLGVAFFFATFGVVEVIIIAVSGASGGAVSGVIVLGVKEIVSGTVVGVGDETHGDELDKGGVVKPSPTPP